MALDEPPPPSTPPLSRDDIVAGLREAGCVFAEDEARLLVSTASSPADLAAMVARRVSGRPLEHVLGWAEFCGLRIGVGPGVFVPRRRTEFLVREALGLIRGAYRTVGAVVVDLCCGSGAVGAALLAALDGGELGALYAVDVGPEAVRCARDNLRAAREAAGWASAPEAPASGPAARAGAPEARAYEGDLYAPLPAALHGGVDVLVVNAPYVPTDSLALMPPEARDHEPRAALDGGPDGLDVQRRTIAGAPHWLAPGGRLLIETSERQSAGTAEAMTAQGLTVRVAECEELDATVVVGTRAVTEGGDRSLVTGHW